MSCFIIVIRTIFVIDVSYIVWCLMTIWGYQYFLSTTVAQLLRILCNINPTNFCLLSLDLRIIHDKKTISDPRRLMHALRFYVSSFKLTKQQVFVWGVFKWKSFPSFLHYAFKFIWFSFSLIVGCCWSTPPSFIFSGRGNFAVLCAT